MSKPGFEIRPDWLARRVEDVIEPDLAIVDPHHHLYERTGEHYLLPELLSDLDDGHRIVGTVFVQCRHAYRSSGPAALHPVGEVEATVAVASEAARVSNRTGVCAGIVAGADLNLGDDVGPVLDVMSEVAGSRFVGIRNSVAWHAHPEVRSSHILPPPGLMADPQFRAGLKQLALRNLTLDIWAYQTQHAEVLELVTANPDLIIVIDHLGGPIACGPYRGQRDEMFSTWKAGLKALSRLPNARLKIGGLGMRVGGFSFHESDNPPSSEDLAVAWRPYVDTAIALFEPPRCMFESNFPVDKGMYSYRTFWNACKKLAEHYSASERAALFSDTAIKTYNLQLGKVSA